MATCCQSSVGDLSGTAFPPELSHRLDQQEHAPQTRMARSEAFPPAPPAHAGVLVGNVWDSAYDTESIPF